MTATGAIAEWKTNAHYVPFDGPTAMRYVPTPVLLPVVAAWRDDTGSYQALSDGRWYQWSFGEWIPFAPPLSDAQRTPR